MNVTVKGGKNVYSIKNFCDTLLIRKITKNLKNVTRNRRQDRDNIVRNLIKLLSEGVTYKIYRRDIKDFYGSVSSLPITTNLEKNWHLSRPTIKLIKEILEQFSTKEKGLPRGLQISAALAEHSIEKFDQSLEEHSEVFFYARFVDDILILTSGNEDQNEFEKILEENLPEGTRFNRSKNKEYTKFTPKAYKSTVTLQLESEFNFLGYNFKTYNPQKKWLPRPMDIDIAEYKIKKIKTRITKVFLAYLKDDDFSLLYDRIKLLTGNYYIFDRDRYTKRTAGIYYSYRYVNTDPSVTTSSIYSLDKFLQNTVLSNKGKISKKLNSKLTKPEKRKILGQTFQNGFKQKVIHHFNTKQMINITKCWSYE